MVVTALAGPLAEAKSVKSLLNRISAFLAGRNVVDAVGTVNPMNVEPLEGRQLLSAAIRGISTDNRGMVMLGVTADLVAKTVNSKTVQILTAGADGKLGTHDDVHRKAKVHYS